LLGTATGGGVMGDRRPSEVPAQALQTISVAFRHVHVGVSIPDTSVALSSIRDEKYKDVPSARLTRAPTALRC
jgi:hypothetical protein